MPKDPDIANETQPGPPNGPRHVAIIMDGNGRWAQAKGRPRLFGHQAGARRVREVVEACPDLGIRYLTVFAFSTENWKRERTEVEIIMRLILKGLDEFEKKADEDMRRHWRVEDGVLVFDGKGRALCTAKDYGDFEMFVDWKIEKHGDSGIYVRGSPQVQIWDYRQHPEGSGGLYNNRRHPSKPSKCADNPIGQWNRFRIKMVGEKVTVWLNGELVVNNVVMENYWNRKKPIYSTGQIELQNHGSILRFRNVFIREIPRKPAPVTKTLVPRKN